MYAASTAKTSPKAMTGHFFEDWIFVHHKVMPGESVSLAARFSLSPAGRGSG
jgi:hypothetical protein